MFLGIDAGTSEVKALLLADDHTLIATAGAALAISDAVSKHNERNPGKEVVYLNYAAVDPALLLNPGVLGLGLGLGLADTGDAA